ncbi:thiamine pyrophosphate-binding protein [Chloroflexota bacterium]
MGLVTGAEAIMEIFRRENVEFVFGVPGATEVLFLDALEDNTEIKYILGLHETVSLGMAEGYARTSGKVGVVNLHTGPGVAAALPMMSNAHQGGVPLLITAGQQDTRLLAQEPSLAGDLVRMAELYSKWSTEVLYAADIPLVLRRAFKVAMHPPAGPVFVSLPQDVLSQSLDFEYVSTAPSFTRLHPDNEAVKLAVELISGARSPAIIVEDGVTKSDALSEVVKFAEMLGARVYQSWMSDVNFPVHHPQYMGDLETGSLNTRDLFESVDVLVVIGAPLFRQGSYLPKPLLPSSTKVIHIDDNSWQIAKNFPVACGIEGDIKVSLVDLLGELEKKMSSQTREANAIRAKKIADETQNIARDFDEKAEKERDQIPIAVTRFMQEIRDAISPDTRIVDDCWSCSGVLRRTISFSEPRSFQRSRRGGSIGWGMSGALGVKLASSDRPVVAVTGDGSAMWSIQSLWTAARYNIPVTYIICANACYRQVRIMKFRLMGEKAKGRYLGTDLSDPRIDFCGLAESMGVTARRVERPEELGETLRAALDSGEPNLVEVYIEDKV